MRFWFSKIASREDAVHRIELYSYLFFLLAAVQIVVGIMIISSPEEARRFVSLPPDAALNYLATAAIVVILSAVLWVLRSRVAAVMLLVLFILVIGSMLVSGAAAKAPSGSLYVTLMAAVLAVRSIQATFKFHAAAESATDPHADHKPAETPPPTPKPQPATDFVSHPKAGVESTAATAAAAQPPKSYDREKWAALLKYDDEIAIVAGRISHLGQRWVDELAHDYLALNDKQYLRRIEEKIHADARAERARSRL